MRYVRASGLPFGAGAEPVGGWDFLTLVGGQRGKHYLFLADFS
jgi:hypothetical protein